MNDCFEKRERKKERKIERKREGGGERKRMNFEKKRNKFDAPS